MPHLLQRVAPFPVAKAAKFLSRNVGTRTEGGCPLRDKFVGLGRVLSENSTPAWTRIELADHEIHRALGVFQFCDGGDLSLTETGLALPPCLVENDLRLTLAAPFWLLITHPPLNSAF